MVQPAPIKRSALPNDMEECDANGIHIEESRAEGMGTLKDELASLRIDREPAETTADGACGSSCC